MRRLLPRGSLRLPSALLAPQRRPTCLCLHGRAASSAARVAKLPDRCTAERLARELKMPLQALLRQARALGENAEGDTVLSAELIELIGLESGVTVQTVGEIKDARRRPPPPPEELASLPLRPPVVTIMGHVDHGKTSMLDAFRGSELCAAEAGGITQTISAFQVDADSAEAMTFIDTPGHEFFSAMRQRGAHATDVVLLVVALDAGVQPTTVQAIQFAQEMEAPIVVAANKVDVPGNDKLMGKLHQQLLQHGLHPEELGGDVSVVPVSATRRLGLDKLREALLLHAEMLELHAEDAGAAEGLVLEAQMQKGMGVLATVLVQRGVLRRGDHVVAGTSYGRVKVLHDEEGRQAKQATPSVPVRVSGLRELPRAGDELLVMPSEQRAREVCEYRVARSSAEASEATQRSVGRKRGSARLVPVLLKADTQGALEAVREGLSHFPKQRVEMRYVRTGVGPLTAADVEFAETLDAAVLGYNVTVPHKVELYAEKLLVPVHAHKVIYSLVDAAKEILEAAIPPRLEDVATGAAEVLQVFELTLNGKDRKEGMSKRTKVAGCKVNTGEATVNSRARVERGGEVVHEGKVISLKHFKQEVRTVRKGSECGMVLANYSDLREGDTISLYEVVSRKPGLYDDLVAE